MKLSFSQGLAAFGIAIPVSLFAVGMGAWALGVLIGELIGWISFIWIGLTVKRILTKQSTRSSRTLMLHSFGRYLLIGVILYFSIKWPIVNVWGVVIGYTLIQLPAAIIRALETKP